MKNVCLAFANGCPRSMLDTVLVQNYLIANSWKIVKTFEEADLVIISTCGVNTRSENKSFRLISTANKRLSKNSRLIILGCLAGIAPKELQNKFCAELIPPSKIELLDSIIEAEIPISDIADTNIVEPFISDAKNTFSLKDRFVSEFELSRMFIDRAHRFIRPRNRYRSLHKPFYIRISKGCKGRCTYCAIRAAAGDLVSKPLTKIVQEFKNGLSSGFYNFILVSGDSGCYGKDIGDNIVNLLEELLCHNEEFKLHIQELNPQWLIKYENGFLNLFSKFGDKFGSITVPIQSGSSPILHKMNRGYSAEEVSGLLTKFREILPNLFMITDIMVGFPGESKTDFYKTISILDEIKFNQIDIYCYDDRSNTMAKDMPLKVSDSLKRKRTIKLLKKFPYEARAAL